MVTAAKKTLVIVESPSKAKTISKYLGSKYKVMASVGHVRDLPKSKMGIDLEDNFEPNYINIRGKGDLIKELKKEAKKADKIYLATDPDREGEAISWHLAYILGLDLNTPCRVVFNEITKNTVKEAIKKPRNIDLGLVDAQQARRVLDRLVGYQISPLLWRKVKKGLSAGRVQSATLKLICDREREILQFNPEEFWTIDVEFKEGKKFTGKLIHKNGKKISIADEASCNEIINELKSGDYEVKSLNTKERSRKAFAPFTTSSLQQDASNKLNFNTKKTMMIAQQLYEGVDVKGRGTTGLITYLRTDSVRISNEAKAAAALFIENNYGKEYLGNNFYTNKKKDIQDAHEAIRPSFVELTPDMLEGSLTKDQFKLYQLIWNRFVASQMAPAQYKSRQLDIVNGPYTVRATGSERIFDGYQRVYNVVYEEDKEPALPELQEGHQLMDAKENANQHFTQPPARYTEASLIKELEEKNIGRPSTYAPIVTTLSQRKYIAKEKKSLKPTDLGFTVNDMLSHYFKEIVDAGFTAHMEDQLDDVELGKMQWKSVIQEFYGPFDQELKVAETEIEKIKVEDQPTGELCPNCGKPMVIKNGRFGDFIACSGYPECKTTMTIQKTIGVKCPKCGKDIVARKSKRGKLFYGCSGYPDCQMNYWDKPVNKMCPKCQSLLVSKKAKTFKLACSNKECDYRE